MRFRRLRVRAQKFLQRLNWGMNPAARNQLATQGTIDLSEPANLIWQELMDHFGNVGAASACSNLSASAASCESPSTSSAGLAPESFSSHSRAMARLIDTLIRLTTQDAYGSRYRAVCTVGARGCFVPAAGTVAAFPGSECYSGHPVSRTTATLSTSACPVTTPPCALYTTSLRASMACTAIA